MLDMLELARTRYTAKHYDEKKKISSADLSTLKEILRLSPSSVNSQPWHYFIAQTPAAKEKILPAVLDFNRDRIQRCSHCFVFTARTQLNDAYLSGLLQQEITDGRFSRDDIIAAQDAGRRHFVNLNSSTPASLLSWTTRQTYLAMGFLLSAAASLGIDSTPIEGLDCDRMDELLGLKAQGLHAVALVTMGYRAADDANAWRNKSRWPTETLFTSIDTLL